MEGLQLNVQRLKEYMSKLVVFPKNGKMKNTKEQNAELKKEKANAVQLRGEIMPIPKGRFKHHIQYVFRIDRYPVFLHFFFAQF